MENYRKESGSALHNFGKFESAYEDLTPSHVVNERRQIVPPGQKFANDLI